MAIIGIDLGTTNSLAAYFTDEGPVIIPNVYNENLTPSVVSVDENGCVLTGKIAKERLLTHPNHTVSVFKRAMGSRKEYSLGDMVFLPEELSSFIIKKLKEDAELYLKQTIDEAVISVPAYFNDIQRRATKLAGEMAGLKIERIVNEPTAAAIAYGLHERNDYTKYLVFDLGGGTFDVSILEKYNNIMEVRAVAGDNYLGGEDFTEVLSALFLNSNDIDPRKLSLLDSAAVRKSAEVAKRAFAESKLVTMSCVLDKESIETKITIDEYKEACEHLFTRLREPIKRAVSDASLSLQDLDTVLLVGGATKLPFIKSFALKLLGRFPASNIDPDCAVALGASIHSAMKARNKAITEIVLTDVAPYTLGTQVSVLRENGLYESGHYCPIIDRNSVVPVSRVERLYTLHDNQKKICVCILQGESRKAADNISLGEVNITVPPGPAGQEAVDVRYTYDINGILEVEVVAVSTGLHKKLVIEKNPGMMSEEELDRRLNELSGIKTHPREREEYKYLLARGERLYEESIGGKREFLAQELRKFDAVLDKQDNRLIRDFCVKFKETLDELEGKECEF